MRAHVLFASVLTLSVALLSTGCSRNKDGRGTGEGTLVPEPLAGEYGMLGDAPFDFESLQRVTDVAFEPVAFGYDSYQVASSETAKIEAVANYMLANRDLKLVVEGHCDERGSREYNLSLGEHRGLAVRAYLISLGVPAERVQTRSYGEEKPVDPGHSEAAWRLNRRGEFALYR